MLKAIATGKKENDKLDAAKIADLLRCNKNYSLIPRPFPILSHSTP